jgi:hypothetical protein
MFAGLARRLMDLGYVEEGVEWYKNEAMQRKRMP